jgi:hypothetical protein
MRREVSPSSPLAARPSVSDRAAFFRDRGCIHCGSERRHHPCPYIGRWGDPDEAALRRTDDECTRGLPMHRVVRVDPT